MLDWENLSIEPKDSVFFKSPLDYKDNKSFNGLCKERTIYENSLVNSSFILFKGQLKDFTYRMFHIYKRNKFLKKLVVKNFSNIPEVLSQIKVSQFVKFNIFDRFPRSEIGIENIISLLEVQNSKTLGVCIDSACDNMFEAYQLILNLDRENRLSHDKFMYNRDDIKKQLEICDNLIKNRVKLFTDINTWFQDLIKKDGSDNDGRTDDTGKVSG